MTSCANQDASSYAGQNNKYEFILWVSKQKKKPILMKKI